MGSSRKRGNAGERVLEGRHVIGLFLLMLVFSGLFFTLGYVMGRDGQVRAAADGRGFTPPEVRPKADVAQNAFSRKPPAAEPASNSETSANSDWEFYHAGDSSTPDDHLRPVANSAPVSNSNKARSSSLPAAPRTSAVSLLAATAGMNLQVAALTSERDAFALATTLRKKNFSTFVQPPRTDKYYHVLVGPYPDQKALDNARKGLEALGFKKAIVKR